MTVEKVLLCSECIFSTHSFPITHLFQLSKTKTEASNFVYLKEILSSLPLHFRDLGEEKRKKKVKYKKNWQEYYWGSAFIQLVVRWMHACSV